MTRSEILDRINQMRVELDVYKSMLTPKRKRSPRKYSNHQKQINEYVKKLNLK